MLIKAHPSLSVITPSFNQGQYIEHTIKSVLNIGSNNVEYIVIDGGSTDETVDIIKRYEGAVTHWVSEPDKGQSHAINKGMALAKGGIVAWLNSDDVYMPDILPYVLKTLDVNKAEVCFGNSIHFKQGIQAVEAWGSDVVSHAQEGRLDLYDYIIQPSSFWTRKAWDLAGPLREEMHFAFDWEWFLRAKAAGVTFHSVPQCLSMYRIHDAHKSGSGGVKRQNEILAIYEEYAPHYAKLYAAVRHQDFSCTDPKSRLTRRLLKLAKKPHENVDIVKQLNAEKYNGYTPYEMNRCLSML